jgi:gamma-glutamyl-gamma-aminobutyrate hydrolase PuuD
MDKQHNSGRQQTEHHVQRKPACRAAPVIATGGGGKLLVVFSRGSGGQAVGT